MDIAEGRIANRENNFFKSIFDYTEKGHFEMAFFAGSGCGRTLFDWFGIFEIFGQRMVKRCGAHKF